MTSQLQAKFCKHAEPVKQKKIAVCNCSFCESGINKSETLSHGISKVTILQNCKLSKLELHHMAPPGLLILQKHRNSTKLEILQKLEIQQNWNSPHGISGFAVLQKQNQQNWNFTTWYLWSCHSCRPAY